MELKRALGAYARTPLAIISLFASLGAGALVTGLSGVSIPIGLAGGLAFWLGLSFALVQTGAGAKAILAQTGAEEKARTLAFIEEAEGFLSRLKVLRLPDPEAGKALAFLIQSAGEYVASCRASGSRSPAADARIAAAIDVVALYLKELDDASTEKRFGQADANPFEGAKSRVLEALAESARFIRDERVKLDGGLTPADRMAIKEELK